MSPPPSVPPELLNRVFRGSEMVRAGVLTNGRLDGKTGRRIFPDVYVHRDVPDTHALRARAAAGVLLPGAVVTGASAAVLWGLDLASARTEVEVTVPPGRNPVRVRGLRVRRAALAPGSVLRRRGVLVTSPEATAVRLAAVLPVEDAVSAVDRMVVGRLTDLVAVRRCARASRGPGAARARRVAGLADGLAGSPQETRLRLLIGASSLPAPEAQFVVRDERGFVARVDFAWPERRVAVEYDGLWHAEPGQFSRDRQRLNRLSAAGWRVVFVTAADLHRPEALLDRVGAALAD